MEKRLLLDTHVVVDLASPGGFDAMPLKVRRLLEDPDVELLLSVASEIEIAIKTRLGKLDLSKDELVLICANASINSTLSAVHTLIACLTYPSLTRIRSTASSFRPRSATISH